MWRAYDTRLLYIWTGSDACLDSNFVCLSRQGLGPCFEMDRRSILGAVVMDYRNAYKEYTLEHPEELVGLNKLKKNSESIEIQLRKAREEKLKRIEECRRILYGE